MEHGIGPARLEHLRSFLGEPVRLVEEARFRVLAFAPGERTPWVTLATDGLSDVARPRWGGGEPVRSELLLGLPAGWPGLDPLDRSALQDPPRAWPLTVLRVVAGLTLGEDRAVEWDATIGGPELSGLLPPDVPFRGFLVGPPLAYPGDLARATTPGGHVRYHGLLALTAGELDYKLGVPHGGSALMERLWQAGVTAVLDPQRGEVVDGPPPWSVRVLLRDRPDHLGQVLDHYLPALAGALADDRARSYLLPLDQGGVRWRLTGPMDVDEVLQDVAGTPDQPLLQEAVTAHLTTVELAPEGDHGLEALTGVLAVTLALAERDDVLAVWFPEQHHVTTPARLAADVDDIDLSYRVEPVAGTDATVTTRGLEALGGREVRLTAPDLRTAEERERRLRRVLSSRSEDGEQLPAAGQKGRHGLSRYQLREAVDPTTLEPYLELVDGGWRGRFAG